MHDLMPVGISADFLMWFGIFCGLAGMGILAFLLFVGWIVRDVWRKT